MNKKKIVIADDYTIIREGLRAMLSREKDLEIVAEAENGREAIHVADFHKPDIILMEIKLPLTNGTDAIRAIKRRNPEIKNIALTFQKTEEYVRAAFEAGADGYVLKSDSRTELLHAIRSILRGKMYLSSGMCNKVVTAYIGGSFYPQSQRQCSMLTNREKEILKLIAEGLKNKQIAAYLSVSLKTIEKHRFNLMKKLDLHSGAALTAYAFENGLVAHARGNGLLC